MKFIIYILVFFLIHSAMAQQNSIGIFQFNDDVGNPQKEGTTNYNLADQYYTIKGAGYNIWFERDEFQFAYNKIEGDFILSANFEFEGNGTDQHRKIGWMIRESMDENAPHASATLHGDGLTVLQWRELKGAFMRDPEDQIFSPKSYYNILQLERKGNEIIFRAAHDNEPLQLIGSHNMENMPKEVLAGLFICSHNPDVVETAKVWNVRIDRPVSDEYKPYQSGWLGCRMEILNVFNGKRKVIYEQPHRFEAPNWMPDGKKLLFNMDGSLYTIPVEGGEIAKLNTGFANKINNDHGISFNGKLLAISHSRDDNTGSGSTVYVLPLEGGTPQQVTEGTPSYWHGWNPNNKEVVYVAKRGRNESYNIYSASIKDGKETQLSFNEGSHVDGPEFSPDGKYIYYNGNQSGTMQIWRMKPNGSEKEQITFDDYNDWFPHISPDGKWIAFISFSKDIPVDSHPSFKRVMLRLMPVSGGAPKVIAYLYGGQGTINVPSWSPDSKHIAFVSNSGSHQ